ncbi:5'-nucleotidase C-terminal domain-containing protein [Atopobacter phocae]|uniref:5'-nucleotidase C-terminal domain-containing protein n=1 Tax=Atopobacter phocae TaxID=136492 RepID=UPI0012EBD3A1|nr:5'-nucleotidase C-terminal domain-containing protein [Atopobacter phocae]
MKQYKLQAIQQRLLTFALTFSLLMGLGTFSESANIFADETSNSVSTTETISNGVSDQTNSITNKTDDLNGVDKTDSSIKTLEEDKDANQEDIIIIHTNDMHGRLKGDKRTIDTAQLKTFIDQKKPTLLLDGGDAFQGLPISNINKGRDMARVMNEFGYDAMAVGNHEFDFGLDTALSYKEQLKFPILSANTFINEKLAFEPYTIVNKKGRRFGIIGLTTPETATKTHPKNIEGVTFKDPIPIAIENVKNLKDKVDQFIFVGHLGIDPTTPTKWRGDELARALSEQFPEASMLVIDGHSHTAIEHGQKFGHVTVVQSGGHLNHVGLVTGKMVDGKLDYEAELLGLDAFKDYKRDEKVSQIVEEASKTFEEATSEVVINDNKFYFDGKRENVRSKETNLGNLITDTLLIYGQDGFKNKTDFSMVNGGGIRESIQPGKVTKGDLIKVNPFGNLVTQIALTGEQVYSMFEHALRADVEHAEDGQNVLDQKGKVQLTANGGFLQVSRSIKVFYDVNKSNAVPEESKPGQRVLQVQIYDRETKKFLPVDLKRTYYMATNDFLAAGGDGYNMLGGEREEGPSIDQVVMDILKESQRMRAIENPFYTINLTQYEDVFPYQRVIQMNEAEFLAMQNSKESAPSTDVPKISQPEVTDQDSSNSNNDIVPEISLPKDIQPEVLTPKKDVIEQHASNKIISMNHKVQQTPVQSSQALPQTGESKLAFAGIIAIAVGAGAYIYQKKRKSE